MRCLGFSILAAVICLTSSRLATACKYIPTYGTPPYVLKVANGKYILFVQGDRDLNSLITHTTKQEQDAVRPLFRQLHKSGLYKNDGSLEPVWTTDEYIPFAATWVSDNGEYMVRHPRWPCYGPSGEIHFYRNGKLFRTRSMKEYVQAHDKIPVERSGDSYLFNTGDRSWIIPDRDWFDEKTLRFSLETKEYLRITFDVTTGDIVDVEHLDVAYKVRRGLEYCLSAAVVLLVSLLAIRLFNPWCRRPTAAPPTSAGPTPA